MRILIRDESDDLELIKVNDIWIEDDTFICFFIPDEYNYYCMINMFSSNFCEKVLKQIMIEGYYNFSYDRIIFKEIMEPIGSME